MREEEGGREREMRGTRAQKQVGERRQASQQNRVGKREMGVERGRG